MEAPSWALICGEVQSWTGTPCASCLLVAGDGSMPPGEQPALLFPPQLRNCRGLEWTHSPVQALVGRMLHGGELLVEVAGRAPAGQLGGQFLTITGGLAPGRDCRADLSLCQPTRGPLCRAEDLRTRHRHHPAQPPAWSRRTAVEGQAVASEMPNQGVGPGVFVGLMGQGGMGHAGASGGWKSPKSP